METRALGSNLEVSALGFGCMNIAWAYGPRTNKEEAVRLLRAAWRWVSAHYRIVFRWTGRDPGRGRQRRGIPHGS